MILMITVIAFLLWAGRTPVGVKVYADVPSHSVFDPIVGDFKTLEDAMDYAELRKTGWRGTVKDFYEWQENE